MDIYKLQALKDAISTAKKEVTIAEKAMAQYLVDTVADVKKVEFGGSAVEMHGVTIWLEQIRREDNYSMLLPSADATEEDAVAFFLSERVKQAQIEALGEVLDNLA